MKKITKVMLAFFAFAFLFSGCEDDVVTSELVLDLSKTGVLEIHLFANLNRQELGLQNVPDGTKVLFSVDYSEFNPNATSGQWTHMGEVSNGSVLMESLPSVSDGVNVRITPESFLYDQVQPHGAPSESITKLFFANPIVVSVYPDQKVIRPINYNDATFGDPAQTVTRRWQGRAIFNQISGDISNLSPGIQITLYNNNWATTTETAANGTFSADVPYGEQFAIMFTALKTVPDEDGNPVQKLHRYTAFKGPYFETSPVAEEIFFNSEIWE